MLPGEHGQAKIQGAGDQVGQVRAGRGPLGQTTAAGDQLDDCRPVGVIEFEFGQARGDSRRGDGREKVTDVGRHDPAAADMLGRVGENRPARNESVGEPGGREMVKPVVEQPTLGGLEFGVGRLDPAFLFFALARDERVDVVPLVSLWGQGPQ